MESYSNIMPFQYSNIILYSIPFSATVTKVAEAWIYATSILKESDKLVIISIDYVWLSS